MRIPAVLVIALTASCCMPGWSQAGSGVISPQKAFELADHGSCTEALPGLKRAAQAADKRLSYRAALAGARCAMTLQRRAETLEMLAVLARKFPDDPEASYVSARYLSQLANQTADHLAATSPNSIQVRKMNAEALESQGKGDEAIAEYRKLLAQDPKSPELHFRIARLLLEKTPPATDEAKHELEDELKVAPSNAAAEFALGEIARRDGDWDTAIGHFQRATSLDAGFVEALLALGMSLNAASRFREAIPSLERYIKMQPEDPAGHYQLATAYSRTGNKAAAERELAEQRRLVEAHPVRRPE
ncbi:MAG TPA: tetratricopeptide repeat protein [Terriglobales bacterium]|nr:tetratricopeptide repeat protein [Terriglobales bacterium]